MNTGKPEQPCACRALSSPAAATVFLIYKVGLAVVEAEIDGVQVGIREAVPYALIAARRGRV